MVAHMEFGSSPGKKAGHEASPGGHSVGKFVGPGHAETVQASENFDKAGLVAAHLAALHDAYMLERGLLPGTSLPDNEAPSVPPVFAESPWKDLKPVSLADMKVGKTHRRHVLEGRLCVKSLKVTSVVNVLVEDSGLATKLILTNAVPPRTSMAQAQCCYPEGARVAVRDPYLTRFPDGLVGVLVEHPADIAFLSVPESSEEDAISVREIGGSGHQQVDCPERVTGNEDPVEPHHHPDSHSSQSSASLAGNESGEKDIQIPEVELFGSEIPDKSVSGSPDVGVAPLEELNHVSRPEPEGKLEVVLASHNVGESLAPAPDELGMEGEPGEVNVGTSQGQESTVEDEQTPEARTSSRVLSESSEVESSRRKVPAEVEGRDRSNDSPTAGATSQEDNSLGIEGDPGRSIAAVHTKIKDVAESASPVQLQHPGEVSEGTVGEDRHLESATEHPKTPEPDTDLQEDLLGFGELSNLDPQSHRNSHHSSDEQAPSLEAAQDPNEQKSKESGQSVTDEVGVDAKPRRLERQYSLIEVVASEGDLPESSATGPLDTMTANKLRILGNQLFAEGKFQNATELYTRAILRAEEDEHRSSGVGGSGASGHGGESEVLLGYSNRAEAWIRLHQYEKALEDAGKALARDHKHLKSLFRKGRALLGLGQHQQALSTLQEAAPRAPLDRDLQASMHECTIAIQQSQLGVFDLSNYYLRGRHVGEFPSSSDFVGQVVINDVGRGRGWGLVLTKDVEAGELLLVSNPIAFMQLQGMDQTGERSQEFVSGKVQEAFRSICENAHENAHAPNKGLQNLHLMFDGERNLPVPSADILSPSFIEDSKTQQPLEAAQTRRIIQLNAFNGTATMGWKNLPGSGEQDNKVEHWGLWWLPSFMNHSCLPNSSQILVGRALFVFASRNLRAGDEITRSYFDIFQPIEQRRELSTNGWGFVCQCQRCKLEDALHNPMAKLTSRYMKLMELAARSKSDVTDISLTEAQASAALKFCRKLVSKLKDLKLNATEDNWVRASFLHYIDMINGDHELNPHLELVVEAMVTVCPGSESTLHMAVVSKDSARRTRGKKSPQFKTANQRALNICRSTYGKQKLALLQSIIDRNDYSV